MSSVLSFPFVVVSAPPLPRSHKFTPVFNPSLSLVFAAYYRATITFTSLGYSSPLGDRTSDEFKRLARQLAAAIESLFTDLPGQQVVTVLQFRWVRVSV